MTQLNWQMRVLLRPNENVVATCLTEVGAPVNEIIRKASPDAPRQRPQSRYLDPSYIATTDVILSAGIRHGNKRLARRLTARRAQEAGLRGESNIVVIDR